MRNRMDEDFGFQPLSGNDGRADFERIDEILLLEKVSTPLRK